MADWDDRETEAYLARIRRTIAESSRLVEQAGLCIAETDRLLESQGLTREQVMGFRFTDAQREAVNRELVRQGMEPLEEEDESHAESPRGGERGDFLDFSATSASLREDIDPTTQRSNDPTIQRSNAELAERQRKFGMMMKPFQI